MAQSARQPVRYLRKVIRITAEDSPNVQRGLRQQRRNTKPDNKVLIPGLLTWQEHQDRRATWDVKRQCEGLDAQWYKGKELLLFPAEHLALAIRRASELREQGRGKVSAVKAMGIDPAQGGDNTCWCIVDELGVIDLISIKTPNTTVVTSKTIELMRLHGISANRVCFDRGGGKEHADRLRLQGFPVRTVAFGESLVPEPKRGMTPFEQRKDQREDRYQYVNRRACLYHEASLLVDPFGGIDGFGGEKGYGIPCNTDSLRELHRQLGLMPLLTDSEGRIRMLPKNKPNKGLPDPEDEKDQNTLTGLIGHSPDEADAFAIAVFALIHKDKRARAGGAA